MVIPWHMTTSRWPSSKMHCSWLETTWFIWEYRCRRRGNIHKENGGASGTTLDGKPIWAVVQNQHSVRHPCGTSKHLWDAFCSNIWSMVSYRWNWSLPSVTSSLWKVTCCRSFTCIIPLLLLKPTFVFLVFWPFKLKGQKKHNSVKEAVHELSWCTPGPKLNRK